MLTVEAFLSDRQITRHPDAPEQPLVSVVLALTGVGLPEATIRSVLAGSFTNFELLIVDDGPETLSPINEFLDRLLEDPRVILIRHSRCSDLSALRTNEGISLARGKAIITVSAQIVWRSDALSALVQAAEQWEQQNQAAPALIVGKLAFHEPALVVPSVLLMVVTLLDRNRLLPDTVLIPRPVFETFGMFDCQIAMNGGYAWDLWLRLIKHVPFIELDTIIADSSADPEQCLALPVPVALFRTLQAMPRNQHLRPDTWETYALNAPTAANDAHAKPRDITLIVDCYETTLDVCLDHYTPLTLARGTYRPHVEVLDQIEPDWVGQTDGALLVRPVGEKSVALAQQAAQSSIPVGYYMDDDLLHVHELGTAVFKNLYRDAPENDRLRASLRIVDAVWVTTDAIAESVRDIQSRVIPHHNSVPADRLPATVRRREAGQPFKIGYVGTGYRVEEFSYLWPAFQRIAEEFAGRVTFEFWGVNPARLPELKAPVTVVPFTFSYFEYLDRLQAAQFDILLVPLLGFPRTRLGKSQIKYYEAAVAGALGIFSDVVPYRSLANQETCLKAHNTVKSWLRILRRTLTMPPDQFDRLRAACLEDVRQHFTNTAQIDLHEAAWHATEFHALTRTARYADGRPRVLYVLGNLAGSDAVLPSLRRMLAQMRRYAVEPVVMVRESSAARLIDLKDDGIRVIAVTDSGEGSLDVALTLLRMIRPALVHLIAASAQIEEACRMLYLPIINGATPDKFEGSAQSFNALLRGYTAAFQHPIPALPITKSLPGQAVCITGMHRSGTSMLTRLLSLCGVTLGPADQLSIETGGIDNREGLWEHIALREINDDLLALLGGTWSAPPTMDTGWSQSPRFDALRQRATQVLEGVSVDGLWGWKDPRTCLTAEFWQGILPHMKVVVCLRDPDEVAASLDNRRNYGLEAFSTSHAQGQTLWGQYYDSLLTSLRPDQVIITHYAVYFHDPEGELRRVLGFLGATVPDRTIRNAARTVSARLKHQTASPQRQLPDKLQILYSLLSDRAGSVCRDTPQTASIPRYATFIDPRMSAAVSPAQLLRSRLRVLTRAASRLDSVEHHARLRAWLIPHNSRRLRAYFLVTSAIRTLRREGITTSVQRIAGWLRGERHSIKKRKP